MTPAICLAALSIALACPAAAQVVTEVTSGDTIVVSGIGKVRLAGIRSSDDPGFRFGDGRPPSPPRTDASTPPQPAVSGTIVLKPERASRTFLQRLVLGRTVRVELDEAGDDSPRAYVFLEDGLLVNAEMLKAGRAELDTSRPFEREEEFRELEAEARSAGVGIWAGVSPP